MGKCTACGIGLNTLKKEYFLDGQAVCFLCYSKGNENGCIFKMQDSAEFEKQQNYDEINKAYHYNQRKVETIDYIEGMGFLEGSIIKYVSRYEYKGGLKDLQKAKYYLDKLIKKTEA